ncbi:hypothetical protein GGQ97_001626 [Sphingomonas kaistensis]|uniref:Uncharacterized protein n=1 Tax=Sphingomonas kaistensis TaxID=298708 RepID=A0A7X5Y602_9SPHN|nr:hypothetical protein [Sphingomonas kaistensis]NJC05833.1 hypothetical protein [Sphingomonas kaistensis]
MLILLFASLAIAPERAPVPGRVHLVRSSYQTRETGEGSNSSSNGSDTVVEWLIDRRGASEVVELDYTADTPKEARTSWQLPVRFLRTPGGEVQLLDPAGMEARVDPWLRRAKLTRAICGRTIFTWNAFTIRCDLDSVKELIAKYDLRSVTPREGAAYKAKGAATAAPLKRQQDGSAQLLTATSQIDPEQFREAAATTAILVAEISGKKLAPEEARARFAANRYAGTITTTFTLDAGGEPIRRVEQLKLELVDEGGTSVREETRTLERLPAS